MFHCRPIEFLRRQEERQKTFSKAMEAIRLSQVPGHYLIPGQVDSELQDILETKFSFVSQTWKTGEGKSVAQAMFLKDKKV